MNIVSIIEKKKTAQELSPQEVEFFVNAVHNDSIDDIQIAAFLMAVCINGMTLNECKALTFAMANSGTKINLDSVEGITVDKHSTGGVGDSTTFVVLPVLAALGYKCAKMSGRGLGHTGGTVDKLESINGLKTDIPTNDFINQVNDVGLAVIGQSMDISLVDKKLYAIRDVTATIDSIPLIASSIMSKKLAGGAKNIVLDVKCGKGAFLKKEQKAIELAEIMVSIAKDSNKNVVALVTRMDEPLDTHIGNSIEILGALNVLKGEKNRLYKVSKALVTAILSDGDRDKEIQNAFDSVLDNGRALQLFEKMIIAQGGKIALEKDALLTAKYVKHIVATNTGYIKSVDCEGIGGFASNLGAGRKKIEDKIQHNVGIINSFKVGDYIQQGQILATIYYNDESLHNYVNGFESLIGYSEDFVVPKPDVVAIIR